MLQTALAGLLTILFVPGVSGQVTAVYPNQIIDFSIEKEPDGSTYKWEIYCDLTVNFAQVTGDCADGEVVSGQGTDAAQIRFKKPGEYIVKIEVWDPVACTNNMKFYLVIVEESLPTAELALDPEEICVNEPSELIVSFTGEPDWHVEIHGFNLAGEHIETIQSPAEGIGETPWSITVMPDETTIYRVVKVTDKNGERIYDPDDPESPKVTLTVHPLPVNTRIYLKE